MPRREGEVFLFGTAMEVSPEKPSNFRRRRPNTVLEIEAGLIEEGGRAG
jgi:hypothetical protein